MADERARRLRKNMTDAERALWRYLRLRQLDGYKFRRQVPIGPYIADFVCLKAMLVIEVDGGQHADAVAYDSRRDEFMRGQGYGILRFWNNEVLSNIAGVWDVIASEIDARHRAAAPPIPTFPHKGGRGSPSR
jgi:very-short-patch-repair endonuclease